MGRNSRALPLTCILPPCGGGQEKSRPTPPRPYPGGYTLLEREGGAHAWLPVKSYPCEPSTLFMKSSNSAAYTVAFIE
jgi:hypothetical protein